MRKQITIVVGVCALTAVLLAAGVMSGRPGETASASAAEARRLVPADMAYPLPVSAQQYGVIDGDAIHRHVVAQADIARQFRDAGNQYWGRIIGLESDHASQRWLMGEFNRLGLDEVRLQEDDLPPQWVPKSWAMRVAGMSREIVVETAQPALRSPTTSSEGLDVEAIYVGMGTPAEFVGRDVRGKAVFIYHIPYPVRSSYRDGVFASSRESASYAAPMKRAAELGAAAIVAIVAVPGTNMTQQMGPVDGIPVPVFTIGLRDGTAIRELIEEAGPSRAPRVNVRLDADYVPGLKTASVWGVLHGRSHGTEDDENIVITADRDGFFEAASDNASGVATMLGLAEYFAKQPRETRRRTISFVGTPGHHNYMNPRLTVGSKYILANMPAFVQKTALFLDANLTAGLQEVPYGTGLRRVTPPGSQYWYAGASDRLREIVVSRFDLFGVPVYKEMHENGPSVGGEIGSIHGHAPTLSMTHKSGYYHSNHDSVDYVTPSALAVVTRAFASIIDEINNVSLEQLRMGLKPPTND